MSGLRESIRLFLRNEVLPYFRHRNKKPLLRQLREMARLWRAYRYVPYQYVKFRMYARDFEGDMELYVPPMLIKKIQDNENDADDVKIVRNKIAFQKFMSARGIRCIEPSWRVDHDGRLWDIHDVSISLKQLKREAEPYEGQLFGKQIAGAQGHGAQLIDTATLSQADLAQMKNLLIQPKLIQHPDMERLFPGALNTIRLDSFLTEDGNCVHNVCAIRVGTGKMIVDNWDQGGLVVGVDISTGRLFSQARRKTKFSDHSVYLEHPDTGVRFERYQLPYWEDVKALAQRAAFALPQLRTLCWDVAIVPDGPLLVEANDHWSIFLLQTGWGGMRDTPLGRYARCQHGLPDLTSTSSSALATPL